jgi:nucleoside-diphosphate-sugar epimerase
MKNLNHFKSNKVLIAGHNECLNDNLFDCSAEKQYRDFLFVDDLMKAIFKCFYNKQSIGEIMNIGTGKPHNIKKVILFIRNNIKLGNPVFGKIPLRKDEILRLYPDISKVKKILNWDPRTSFQKGIKTLIRHYKI